MNEELNRFVGIKKGYATVRTEEIDKSFVPHIDGWDYVDGLEGKEKAKALYEIKQYCIENNEERPKWWYTKKHIRLDRQ